MAEFNLDREVKAWNTITDHLDSRGGSNNELKGSMLHDEYCSIADPTNRASLLQKLGNDWKPVHSGVDNLIAVDYFGLTVDLRCPNDSQK
jgi:hypothetical protein